MELPLNPVFQFRGQKSTIKKIEGVRMILPRENSHSCDFMRPSAPAVEVAQVQHLACLCFTKLSQIIWQSCGRGVNAILDTFIMFVLHNVGDSITLSHG